MSLEKAETTAELLSVLGIGLLILYALGKIDLSWLKNLLNGLHLPTFGSSDSGNVDGGTGSGASIRIETEPIQISDDPLSTPNGVIFQYNAEGRPLPSKAQALAIAQAHGYTGTASYDGTDMGGSMGAGLAF